jgi:hypothetical protein
MHPKIVNINSPVDVTREVEACFMEVDFDAIRQPLCPFIEPTQWTARLLELGCIGLISRMSFEQTYAEAMPYEELSEQRRAFPPPPGIPGKWQNEDEGRPPRRGEGITVVEPLGMYVENLERWTANSIQDSAGILNSRFAQLPAILLCPEAMTEFAGRLYPACQHLRHPFESEEKACAFILNSVLLHEFGHHFFPTQKCGGALYLNEALANLFALYGLKHGMKTNLMAGVDQLVYKTFLFQHSAYSAYRPLNATFEIDPHTRFAVGMCFTGSIWQWASLKGKSCRGFPIDFGASRQMGICLDYEASQSLWYDEIGILIGQDDPWLGRFWGEGLAFHARCRRNVSPTISPDFLADLYERRHLNSWMNEKEYALGIMNEWWGYSPESQWPNDCLDWKEIETLANLSDSAAKVVSKCERCLDLNNLEELSESAAVILGKSGQFYGIKMPKLKTLSSTAAAGLCGFREFFLRLDELTSISDDTAQCLGKHHGELSLKRVTMLSEAAAEGLSKIEGRLHLDGLTNLSDAASVHLGKHCGELSLNGLQTLTDFAAEHLGKHRGTLLLDGLTSLSDCAIAHLSNNTGKLSLHNITRLTDTAAEALGRHVGYLHLGGVKSLSDVAAEELSNHHGDLCLFGLTSLTDAAAEGLSRHKGMLSLSGLRDLSSAAAEYLCSHDGRLVIHLWKINNCNQQAADILGQCRLLEI